MTKKEQRVYIAEVIIINIRITITKERLVGVEEPESRFKVKKVGTSTTTYLGNKKFIWQAFSQRPSSAINTQVYTPIRHDMSTMLWWTRIQHRHYALSASAATQFLAQQAVMHYILPMLTQRNIKTIGLNAFWCRYWKSLNRFSESVSFNVRT